MSFVEHLEELRKRILISISLVLIFSIASYFFVPDIIKFLTKPVGTRLVYLAPTEAFFTQLKVAFFSGLLLAFPFIIYQIWRFISPAFTENRQKFISWLVPLSCLFFAGGLIFGYFVVVRFGLKFLMRFATDSLNPMFSLGKFISFVTGVMIPFGLIFQMPIIIIPLVKLNLIDHKFLKKQRKYVLLIIFILAAILTPPDVISQVMMALPLILLYEVSIIWARIIE